MSVPTIEFYEQVIYSTDRLEVRLINKEVDPVNLVEDVTQYNYAVVHKEYGTIEGHYQKCADAFSVVEQLEFHLRTKSYVINSQIPPRPDPDKPRGRGPLRSV
jgi:hypothetical protein